MTDTQVKLTKHDKNPKGFWFYILNAPVFFAKVHAPQMNDQSGEMQFSANVFVPESVADEMLGDEIKLNKEFKLVGKDKTKTRKIKYPLSSQVEEGKHHYDAVAGLGGISVTADEEFTFKDKKTGEEITVKRKITVLDSEGKNTTALIGNGSICDIKCYGYRSNKTGQLNITLDTIKVKSLVPYEAKQGQAGVVEDEILGSYTRAKSGSAEQAQEQPEQAVPVKAAKTVKPKKQEAVESFDDDLDSLPF